MTLFRLAFCSASFLGLALSAQAAAVVFSANGDLSGISPTVNVFRAALGTVNPPGACTPAPCTSGRREINWDGVPAGSFNPFPGDFFNAAGSPAARTRGLSITSPGTLAVSATNFGFAADFPAFSSPNIFGAIGSNQMDISFHVPGQPASAASTVGMGIVFIDVELPGTTMTFYDLSDAFLAQAPVVTGQSGSFSFLGVLFDAGERVGRVHLNFGDVDTINCIFDCVAMDDFLYGEPLGANAVPEPSSLALTTAGALLVLARQTLLLIARIK